MSYGRTGENNALSKGLDGIAFSVRKGTKFGRERRPFFNKMIKESGRFNFLLANILCGSEKSGKIYRETFWSEGLNAFDGKREQIWRNGVFCLQRKILQGAAFCIIMK